MGINEILKIGDRIKTLRKSKGISQKDFAAQLQIPYSTYSNYENNNREPKKEQITQIASALGVTEYELLGMSLEKNMQPLETAIAFLNYLLSIGYEVHESPNEDSDWVIHIKESGENLFLSSEEMESLENSTKENIEGRIYKFLKDKQ